MSGRLGAGALDTLPAGVGRPGYALARGVGIVHLGIGAFHRAHQAVYTDDALAAAGGDWAICGVSRRSRRVADRLAAQDWLFSVLERGAGGDRVRVIASVRRALLASEEPAALRRLIAAPATRVLTLTVTEAGYRHDSGTGRLRRDDPALAADLADASQARTVLGQIVRGLQKRQQAGSAQLAVVCCDNLAGNGALVRRLVMEFCGYLPTGEGERVAGWIGEHVTFPATMVDRIVPATTDADLAVVRNRLGVTDRAAVVCEPFRQWVVEDIFPGGRPAWECGGAILTDDVAPYETLKLRLLNATHSTLAYLGLLAGCETVAEAMRQDPLAEVLERLAAEEVMPVLDAPPGVDLAAYCAEVLDRYANPRIVHRLEQIGADGSHKLPQRLLPTVRLLLERGREPRWAALTVAAWIRYLRGVRDDGAPLEIRDVLAGVLSARVRRADGPAGIAAAALSSTEVFGDDLAESPVFRGLVTAWLGQLMADGVVPAVRSALARP